MAQKREKEETELKVPETLSLCTPPIAGAAAGATAGANAGAISNISGSASDDRRSSSPSSLTSPERSDLDLDLKADLAVDSRSRSASSPLPDLHRKPCSSAETAAEASNNGNGDSNDFNGVLSDRNGDSNDFNGDLSNSNDLNNRNGDSNNLSNRNGDFSNRNGDSNNLSNRNGDLSNRSGDLEKLSRRVINRCSGCRRKVGLMGFRCRCGETFCSDHRYSDRHDCSYDYKAAGREAIARENPVVRAAKILKV